MLKITGYTLVILIASMLFVAIYNKLEKKPFKFEEFEKGDEVREYLIRHYPVGSDVEILFRNLKKVGAKYQKRSEKIPPKEMGEDKNLEYDAVYVGDYANNWISRDPMGYYDLYIFTDKEQKIRDISVYRWSKFS